VVILEQITIEGFRGFSKKAVFDFGSHATIFGGPNGSGKTSVFDALEWAILGRVARLAGTRDFVMAGSVERNVFSSNAIVTATFSTQAGKLVLHKSSDSHRALLSGNPIRW
jgi:DNA repair exonuclease SbcCD ATPase subunit